MLQRLYDEKQIYKDKQDGYYSVRQEQFLTDKERGPDGEFGPEWGQVEYREEENYYFRLAEHKEWLLELSSRAARLRHARFPPGRAAQRRRETRRRPLHLAPEVAPQWGIELPFDPRLRHLRLVRRARELHQLRRLRSRRCKTSTLSPQTFRERWPALHVIGKDILIPAHGIYWPIMLKALGFPRRGDAEAPRPRLVEHQRREDEQEPRQRRRSRSCSPTNTAPKRCATI